MALLWIVIYSFINGLFVYKYAHLIAPYPISLSLLYLVAIGFLFFCLLLRRRGGREPEAGPLHASGRSLGWLVAALAVSLYLIMRLQDPETIAVGRYPALEQWIDRLFRGEFPYQSPARPSALPFQFIVAIPFYLLGDLGLMQIAAFLAFSTILLRDAGRETPRRRLWHILLLAASPIFLYELVVRSDLFANMVLVILYGALLERVKDRRLAPLRLFALGIAGGFVLATRLIVLIPLSLYLAAFTRARNRLPIGLIGGILIGFSLVVLPFLLWDPAYFIHHGPHAIQASYASPWIVALIALLALLTAARIRSMARVHTSSALLLLLAVLLPFLQGLSAEGWDGVILSDRFDISYFAFCLPFLVLTIDFDGI